MYSHNVDKICVWMEEMYKITAEDLSSQSSGWDKVH